MDWVECAPPRCERLPVTLLALSRLGGDVCVGDAMGDAAVSVHGDLTAEALAECLREEGAAVAIVVDDNGRLLGLVDAAGVVPATTLALASELARSVTPVLESAPLTLAVDRMVHERARALPVVDGDGCVVALLTDLDALRWVARRGGSR